MWFCNNQVFGLLILIGLERGIFSVSGKHFVDLDTQKHQPLDVFIPIKKH